MSDEDAAALLTRLIDAINTQVAETRAVRVVLETFVRRVLSTTPDPQRSFAALRADVVAILDGDVEHEAVGSDARLAAETARFHAESLLAGLEVLPLSADGAKPERPN